MNMRPTSASARRPWLAAVLLATACTSDLPAPDNYNPAASTGGGTGTTGAPALMVSCDEALAGAVDATFSYKPTVTGGDGFYTYGASGLPDGLAIDATSGLVSGVPQTEGPFSITITVSDTAGGVGMATCDGQIGPRIGVDLDLLLSAPPFCVQMQQSLLDFVVPGTGDGTPITCDIPGGGGNGKVPAGLGVDPNTCQITGASTETRHGTWVWIVRGTQSGAEVFIPYCDTHVVTDPAFYTVEVEHDGLQMMGVAPQASALIPIVRRFSNGMTLGVGGMIDPLFRVTDASACPANGTCTYGYAYSINASPFDMFAVTNEMLVTDGMGQGIGMTHEMMASGPPVSAAFEDRPWVLNVGLDYCLSGTPEDCSCPMGDAACCGPGQDPMTDGCETAATRVRANGNGNLEMGVLMLPN